MSPIHPFLRKYFSFRSQDTKKIAFGGVLILLFFIPEIGFGQLARQELATPPPDAGSYTHNSVLPANAMQIAEAMDIPLGDIISATLGISDPSGGGVSDSPLGVFFPNRGNTFAVLSTGQAASAEAPNDSESTSSQLSGLNNSQGNDMVQLVLRLRVPSGATCLNFSFAYYSEEFPEWVGSQYNDAFTVEIGGTNIQIINNQVVTPFNFAFDTEGNNISVNTVFGFTLGTGTTYDGVTPLLLASSPIEGLGNEVQLVFTIQDLGDSIYDSAVFLDNFFWSFGPSCLPGASLDADGDALLDDWEINGIDVDGNGTIDLDLPAMGADPQHKDIFIEIDYMVEPGLCFLGLCLGSHTHKPKTEAINLIINAFANAPVGNPDGTTGIRLHIDYGPDSIMNPVTGSTWGSLSQSDVLAHDNELGSTNSNVYNWAEFDQLKGANGVSGHFSIFRADVFHYVIFAHDLGGNISVSGISRDIPESDFIVSLGSWTNEVGTVNEQAGTFMHELGHNLGLRHGGDDHANYEPNYLSIMNYSFQTRGLRKNGVDANFDYSQFVFPDLNELSLNETIGLNGNSETDIYGTRYFCGSTDTNGRMVNNANNPIDWNCDGADGNPTPVVANINRDLLNSTLRSFNDWVNIVFSGGAVGKLGQQLERPLETEVIEITQEEDNNLSTALAVEVVAPPNLILLPGQSALHNFHIINAGENLDNYSLLAMSSQGWSAANNMPSEVTLEPGAEIVIPITVTVPSNIAAGEIDQLSLKVISKTNPLLLDIASTLTKVAVKGDIDGDGDVDRNDLNVLLAARNNLATGLNDPRDLDKDGKITALDGRKLVLLCTRPNCATE